MKHSLRLAIAILPAAFLWTPASDHSDVPVSGSIARQDANLTDLHAFTHGPNLVISLCSNPAIPRSAAGYIFPSDVTFEINIDTDSPVDPSDPMQMGGTILEPLQIREDVTFRIRFRADGSADVKRSTLGQPPEDAHLIGFSAGLRDDPFIRGPRQGRNMAAIVLEFPLESLPAGRTLLIWATSKVEEFDGMFQDLAGRSLRSMFPENNAMNVWHPRLHTLKMGAVPDVMIYDLSRPARYPNGRALTDDVVDLVGDPRVLANDAPFPSANDRPFLETFPYLAEPHPPVP